MSLASHVPSMSIPLTLAPATPPELSTTPKLMFAIKPCVCVLLKIIVVGYTFSEVGHHSKLCCSF